MGRKLELTVGYRPQVAKRGAAHHDKEHRRGERELVEHAERAYDVMVAHWQPNKPGSGD